MSMPAYKDELEPHRMALHRRQLPTPASSTDMFLAAILEEMQSQGHQIADIQDELAQVRTDLALMRVAIPPVPLVSVDASEPEQSAIPSKAPPNVADGVPDRLGSRRRGNHRR